MTNRVPQTDRRGVLRGALVTAVALPVLAACDATNVTPRNGQVAQTGRAEATDAALVATVGTAINSTLRLAARGATTNPATRSWTTGVIAMHRAHLAKLGVTPSGATDGGRPVSHGTIVAGERTLQHQLVAAAQQAQSGALAQVLASMAAAIGQRLVTA